MIKIQQSKTADSRYCDPTNVTKEQLLCSTRQHQDDVWQGLGFFMDLLAEAGDAHDSDKFSDIDQFHHDFQTGFSEHTWWDNHKRISRHHLMAPEGVPEDVNLIDVLEFITDCVMAGMARSGSVYDLEMAEGVLERAFKNTVELLKREVVVEENNG